MLAPSSGFGKVCEWTEAAECGFEDGREFYLQVTVAVAVGTELVCPFAACAKYERVAESPAICRDSTRLLGVELMAEIRALEILSS